MGIRVSPPSSTTYDVTTTHHGLVPTAPNDNGKFLDGTGVFSTPTGSGANWSRSTLSSDIPVTDDVLTDATGLSFSVTSGHIYWFEFFVWYTTDVTATGSRWVITAPNSDRLATSQINSLAATTVTEQVNQTNINLPATSNATSPATVANRNSTTGGRMNMKGVIVPSANGTVQLRFCCELATTQTVTVKVGSFVDYTDV